VKTTLRTDLSVADVCNGFVYNELEGKGLFGLGGRLTIQPEYQRNYIYAEGGGKRDRRGRRRRTEGICSRFDSGIVHHLRPG